MSSGSGREMSGIWCMEVWNVHIFCNDMMPMFKDVICNNQLAMAFVVTTHFVTPQKKVAEKTNKDKDKLELIPCGACMWDDMLKSKRLNMTSAIYFIISNQSDTGQSPFIYMVHIASLSSTRPNIHAHKHISNSAVTSKCFGIHLANI